MVITRHAQERLDMRCISSSTAHAVVINGEREPAGDGLYKYIFNDFVVVVDEARNTMITAYEKEKPVRKKRKKKGRKRPSNPWR